MLRRECYILFLAAYNMDYWKEIAAKPSVKLLLGAVGVYIAYLQLSVLNEKIYSYPYPSHEHPHTPHIFEYADLVQLISSIFCIAYALLSATVRGEKTNPLPWWQILTLGALYTLNVNTLNYSLYYIPYPVRVVGDKLGYLTAVVVAVFFTRVKSTQQVKLGPEKLWRALMISIGAIGFAYFYRFKANQIQLYIPEDRWKGYSLIGISVITQALFSDSQAYNKVTYHPSPGNMIFSVNLVTMVLNLLILIVSGTLMPSLEFCLLHQQIVWDIFLVGLLTVLGQVSIYFVVLNFKQHMFPLISTTRKILTILYSIYYFNHATNLYMWIALVMVFGGIIYELVDELYYDLSGEQKIRVRRQPLLAVGPEKEE